MIVHTKIKTLSSLTRLHFVPILYDFFSGKQKKIFREIFMSTQWKSAGSNCLDPNILQNHLQIWNDTRMRKMTIFTLERNTPLKRPWNIKHVFHLTGCAIIQIIWSHMIELWWTDFNLNCDKIKMTLKQLGFLVLSELFIYYYSIY